MGFLLLKYTKNTTKTWYAAAMKDRGVVVSELAKALCVSRSTLYTYIAHDGSLKPKAEKMLGKT
jgi:predicted DNA-binding transcriptional regulator AlpA